MKKIQKSPSLTDELRAFDIFKDVDDEVLQWLMDKSDYLQYDKDEKIFVEGQPVDHMQIILSGGYVIQQESEGRRRELGMWKAPYVAGVLPFSRMKETNADGVCLETTRVLRLHRNCFVEMVNISYDLTQALVTVMTNRVRDFQQMRLMDEKLMALGKMSAGLAHELNNPASSMVRNSQELQRHLAQTPERFKSIVTMHVTPEQVDAVNGILFDRIKSYDDSKDMSLMEREERKDELLDWMDDHEFSNADDLVDTLVDWDFREEHLDQLAATVSKEALEPVLSWIETNLTTEGMVTEIQTASRRITELIESIKSYSHMDQEPSLEKVDIHQGIRSTVTMLFHKLKKKNIQLHKELAVDQPQVKGLAGELNQVWTNLISNALDALPDKGGELTIRSFRERDCICVEVEDNGPGIPENILTRVFEPFFTTKSIGEGTGMGLDIVRRVIDHHNGSVNVESEPGKTVFRVCFPAWQDAEEE